MSLVLEDYVPYDRSSMWRLHDAYFAARGARAWTGGEIPHVATSSYSMARQHARMLVGLVAELEAAGDLAPAAEVRLFEAGCGLGDFAGHLLGALARGCGPGGRALLPRLRYVLTDYSHKNVREAVEVGPLVEPVRAGLVTPALFDLANPGRLVDLDGRDVAGGFTAAFANYVCCALPPKILRKTPAGIEEKLARVELPNGGPADSATAQQRWSEILRDPTRPGLATAALQLSFAWRVVPSEAALPDPFHREVFRAATAPHDTATVVYPIVFLDFVRALAPWMVPGGTLFVSDYGSTRSQDLAGLVEISPTRYGNTLNHGVSFALLDAFCRHAGLPVLRTRSPLRSIHRAAVRYGRPVTPAFERAFRAAHVRDDRGEALIDLRLAAAARSKAGDHKGAARLYRRGLALDPESAELCYRLGDACFKAAFHAQALRYLRRGRRLDHRRQYDFDFLLGRVHYRLDRDQDARRAFRRALRRRSHPATLANLALVLDRLGLTARAAACCVRSLALAPDGESATIANRLLRDIRQRRDDAD